MTGLPLNESIFTFLLFDKDESTLAVSLLFQENSLKIFFFKKSMFVAFLYIALILGFSQSIVSRARGDRDGGFRPLVHPLESEDDRGPSTTNPKTILELRTVLTSTNQPPKSYFITRIYSMISLYKKT